MRLTERIRMKDRRAGVLLEGCAAVLLLWLSWCFSTIAYQGERYMLLHVIAAAASLICYVLCIKNGAKMANIRGQLLILDSALLLFFGLLLVSDIRRTEYRIYFALVDMAWIAGGIYCLGRLRKRVSVDICAYYPLLLLMAVSAIFALEPFEIQVRWDGALYELACRNMDIHSLSSLGAYGHLSQAYGGLYCLLNGVINHTRLAMAALNIIFYLGSIVGVWLLMRHQFPGRRQGIYLAGTAFCAFSPFFLGMVNYYSLDYATACIFIWVMYFAFSGRWILHFGAALCFCFTKEPAIVAYGGFCLGIVVMNWCGEREGGIWQRMKRVFCHYEYYLMLLAGALWFVMYLLVGGWSGGNGEFGIDGAYAMDKLKVLYVLNFNWLIVLTIIAGSIMMIWNKAKKKTVYGVMWWIPLVFSLAMFTVFSVLFRTVNHARYAAAVPLILYLMAFSVLVILWKEKQARNGMLGLALLMLVSSYKTIDFVSLLCFPRVNTGNAVMISTGTSVIGDSMIYNKEMLGEEAAFNQALGYAIEQELLIYIPMWDGSMYAFDGMMLDGVECEGYYKVVQYWDAQEERRYNYAKQGTQPFTVYELKSEYARIPDLMSEGQKKGCYIYSEIVGAELAEEIKALNPTAQYKEFSYRGWVISMLIF